MLLSLHVKNLALIEEEEVMFTDGLNILTGETGAGKSIIIGSINLGLGARADKSIIRTGSEYALIELTFRADNAGQLKKIEELGLEPEEDGIILIKRKILPNRSICSICGETVTLKQLREAGELLIDIYGNVEFSRSSFDQICICTEISAYYRDISVGISLFPDKFKEIVTQCFLDNNESFQKLFNDPEFYQKVQDVMAKELYKTLRKD